MERNEINIKEMFELLSKSRHLIAGVTVGFALLGFILSFFIVPTMYSTSVYLDPSNYEINNEDLLLQTERMHIVGITAAELVQNPRALIKGTKIETSRETKLIKITVEYPSSQVTNAACERVGLEMLVLAKDLYFKKLEFEGERLKKILERLDQTLAAYTGDSYDINQATGNVIVIEMDPAKKQLLAQKGEKLVALEHVQITLDELTYNPAWDPVNWLYYEAVEVKAKHANKVVYITLTAFMGLALSCFIALVRYNTTIPENGKVKTAG